METNNENILLANLLDYDSNVWINVLPALDEVPVNEASRIQQSQKRHNLQLTIDFHF